MGELFVDAILLETFPIRDGMFQDLDRLGTQLGKNYAFPVT